MPAPSFAAGMDYTINMNDLTVTFPAGAPQEQCVPFFAVDDDLALEGNETFQFVIEPSPNTQVGSPDMAEVTIIDQDTGMTLVIGTWRQLSLISSANHFGKKKSI